MTVTLSSQPKVLACRECDNLMYYPLLQEGQQARCKRCRHVILYRKPNPIDRSIAIALAGLILAIPAIFLPIMSMKLFSINSTVSLSSAIVALWQNQLYFVALVTSFFCILAPLSKLFVTLILSFQVKLDRIHHQSYVPLIKFYQRIDSWEMLEVFMIGILVSIFKLRDDADLFFDFGLVSYILFMICIVALKLSFDNELLWNKVEIDD
ncbi:paraquat-inducible protein A [Thalassotalea mangrovi]|uniref:Paraquat-inducible protein A n=1 Tax=Thalassotalea mangrovi TaxID=2572245 RepID=A0A4U1B5K5_9GAMM|nr:paraquat-inducible protein A [Thalassotalea mangrovi]TKB44909.1 paraquat-inducible protein A [Thalassotalea mangrovi]